MHIRERGPRDARTALLLHGQLLDGAIYDALAERLAATHRVLIPDLPGYGSSALLAPHTLDRVRERITEELLARGVRELDIVGYSLGTYHALGLALEEGLTVRRLYLLGAVAAADAPVRAAFAHLARAVESGADLADFFAAAAFPPAWASEHAEEVGRVKSAIRKVTRASLVADLLSMTGMPDLRPRLKHIRAETMIRTGTLDANTPASWAEEIARCIPGARMESAAGVGHVYLTQDAASTVESVVGFLTR
jgi:3-oxoadipate enol-lactonase